MDQTIKRQAMKKQFMQKIASIQASARYLAQRGARPVKGAAVLALATLLAACGLPTTPNEVRELTPFATRELRKPPTEAAYCIAGLMDERMRFGIAREAGFNNQVRIDKDGAAVISTGISAIALMVMDLSATDTGSQAKFYINYKQLRPLSPRRRIENIESRGLSILDDCAG